MASDDHSAATRAADGAASWATHLTSAIGADHIRAGTPNQDAVAAAEFEGRGGSAAASFAVADGHGHARHFRSDRGSKFGVAAAVAAAEAWADTRTPGVAVSQASASQLVSDVVARWRDLVADDLADDPLTPTQQATLLADDQAEVPYGATLLLGVLWPDVAVLAQIGDGDMVLVLPDGRHLEPIPRDSRLDGTQTTSLCQLDAVSAFRVALVNLAKTPVFAVFAATDGYGNAQAEINWQQGLAADLVQMGSEYGLDWIGSQLGGWAAICASSDGSGDDSSVALALNSAVILSPPPKPVRRSPASRAHDDKTLPFVRRHGVDKTLPLPAAAPSTATARPGFAQRPALWIGGAIVAIAAVVAVVFLWVRAPRAQSPAFRPHPTLTHRATKPRRSPTASASPSPKGRPTATPTTRPTSGSGLSVREGTAPMPRLEPTR